MPELPEVETVKRTLNKLIAGKTIEHVEVRLARIIQKPEDPELFAAWLAGRTFQKVERRGKFLRLCLDELVLVSHLRMEGRYGVYQADEPVEKHTHVIFRLQDGLELRYKDVRQFGTMHLFLPGEEWEHPPLNKLGMEPLDEQFTWQALRDVLQHRKGKIKSLLLNQSLIAGIGNIYADEALYAARLHPERSADSLTTPEWKRLHEAIVKTLQDSVAKGGSSIKSYVNGQGEMGMFQQELQAYGREHEPCLRCGRTLRKIIVGGRGTHYCSNCQRMKRKKTIATPSTTST